jgi:hypothetical protein
VKDNEEEEMVVATSAEKAGLVFPVKKSLRADLLAVAVALMRATQLEVLRPRQLKLELEERHGSRRWIVVVVGWRWFEL